MILGVSGHREIVETKPGSLTRFARLFLAEVRPRCVVIGMAMGWDMAVADACVDLGIPFAAEIPFPDQARDWPEDQRQRWVRLTRQAAEVRMTSRHFLKAAYFMRNMEIVNRSDEMAVLLDPATKRGGTLHATLYARSRGVIVHDLWPRWKSFQGS